MLGLAENSDELERFVALMEWEVWRTARDYAARHGMNALVGTMDMCEVVKQMLRIAEAGLKARGLGEEIYLSPLYERTKSGPPALTQMEMFNKEGVQGLIRRFAFSTETLGR